MKKLYGLIGAIFLVVLITAGCSEAPEAVDGSQPSGASAVEDATAAEPVSSGTAESEASKEEWPRTYVDALGREIVLEQKPEKTALLFFRNFEHMFLLDESPAAAADLYVLEDWESLAPYKDNEIEDIGSITEPNMEKLLDIEPDVIIALSNRYEKYGEQLEKIAPVITVDSNENDWQGALREYGEIFAEEQKAEQEITRIEALIADSREQLKAFEDRSFAVIMLGGKEQFWAFTTQFVFNKDNGLGLNPPANYADMSSKGEELSLEGLLTMNPDYMFVADIGGSRLNLQKYLDEMKDNEAWKSLNAVKNGRIYALDSSIAAGGPLGIELGVTTIVRNVMGQ